MGRKIIQAIVFEGNLIALSDDGVLWSQAKNPKGPAHWSPMIPQLPQLPLEELLRNGAAAVAAIAEQNVDDLVSEVLMDGAAAAPLKATPAKAKSAEKPEKAAAPAAKTKAKLEEEAKRKPAVDGPPIPIKYLAVLGGLLTILAIYFVWPSGVRTPAELAAAALTAGDSKDRVAAVVELNAIPGNESLAELRRVSKESKDPAVITMALNNLIGRVDAVSLNMFLDYLASDAESVRAAAFKGTVNFMGLREDEYPFVANDPEDKRAAVVKSVRDQIEIRKKNVEEMKRKAGK